MSNEMVEINRNEGRPKILIGIPGFAGIQPEVQESMMGLIFRAGRDLTDYDVAVAIPTKREQFRARNHLVRQALDNECDWLLMLDDDMSVPPNLLSRLIAHDKDVVGALYYQRGGAFHPVIMRRHENEIGEFRGEFYSPLDPVIKNPGLHEVDIIGGGCMLFKVNVFKKLTEPYFWWEATSGTDIAICSNLKKAGVSIWIDTTIELGHLGNKTMITSRSVPEDQRVMGRISESLWESLKTYYKKPDEWIRDRVEVNGSISARADAWGQRETDKDIHEYYREDADWHVFNLAYWCIHKTDPLKQWVMTQAGLTAESRIIDYSTGIGHLAFGIAEEIGATVWTYDIAGAGTEKFIAHRIAEKKRGSVVQFLTDGSVPDHPPNYGNDIDGACLISAIEHLTHPYETLEWLIAALKPGGWLVCDWEHGGWSADNPQHITRYDMTTFETWMRERGMDVTPEHSWLFYKRIT